MIAGETILLVEDDDALRQMAARVLRSADYHVVEAVNGEDALSVAKAHGPIDLLITDVVMPKIGGIELALMLRARDSELRVVYMSGYSEPNLKTQAVIGADAPWLMKPFSSSELLREARSLLNGRAPSS
jgi:two-component system cell cycle sensor histidine kinase/response regulator CckA